MQVIEYCYSFRKNKQSNYGLYFYVYNPQGLALSETSGQNKVQIAVGDEVHIAAIFSAHWDAGIFASDVVPDAVASTLSENHGSIVLNFQNGFSYTVK